MKRRDTESYKATHCYRSTVIAQSWIFRCKLPAVGHKARKFSTIKILFLPVKWWLWAKEECLRRWRLEPRLKLKLREQVYQSKVVEQTIQSNFPIDWSYCCLRLSTNKLNSNHVRERLWLWNNHWKQQKKFKNLTFASDISLIRNVLDTW
jgi:hypothetical protein